MKTAIVIPARYASTRLPGKPLLRETGKFLIQHVYERACQAQAEVVLVATDDQRILDAVVIVNLQGDEPLIEPASLNLLPELLRHDAQADVATLAVPIVSMEA